MYEYRQVIYRMRLGESDRSIAKAGLMGRRKASELRQLAKERGWLAKGSLPDDSELSQYLEPKPAAESHLSLVVPHADEVERWWRNGIQGTTIHQTLERKYDFSGSYSCVRRYLATLKAANPEATTILEFEPAEAAQVDFGSLSDANRQLKDWILQTAGNRIHGTTKQKPLSAFIESEKHLLTALPDVPPELATWAKVKVHGNCHVQFENCYYSAPFRLVHQQLWLKAAETSVKLFRDLKLVAVHPRLKKPGTRSTIPATGGSILNRR